MNMMHYSVEIADAINDFLTNDDWHFTFDEKRGLFKFGISHRGVLKKIEYAVDVKDDEYLVYAICPLGVRENDAELMSIMAEFICRANYCLMMGNFELDCNDGEIRYKVHICCGNGIPDEDVIKRSIICPSAMFERYGPGITAILFEGATAKEAIDKCENDKDDLLRKLLLDLMRQRSTMNDPDDPENFTFPMPDEDDEES